MRVNIRVGMHVGIVLKEDQPTGYITYGVVQHILTKSRTHSHGIKGRLDTHEAGQVKEFVT